MHPPAIIPAHPCHTIWLANLLANEEIAQAHDGYIVVGVEGNILTLSGIICKVAWLAKRYFSSLLRSNFCSANSFSIFFFGNNICLLDFQHPAYEGEKEGEEEVPSPHYASSSSSSFTETYPHFPAWQYDVMNPDGTYSFMPLTRSEHVPNVPWPDPVCS